MRAILTFAAVAFGAVLVPMSAGLAADTPSAAQIIQSLSPPGGSGEMTTTRGIRLGGQPPAAAPPAAAPPAATAPVATAPAVRPASTGAAARPSNTAAAVRPRGEANLSVPFATGSANISPAAARVLDQLGMALASPSLSGSKFRVEGHTDTVGAPDSNKALSDQRAVSVTDYLATKHNIDRARLTPVGMGQDGLLIETGPGVANAANRRVLVVNLEQ
ncbi:MAG: OmpA family protein [Acetobacteraceae bacterium]|nr:OmpA family protein [Acetobacteraceae bacterium]